MTVRSISPREDRVKENRIQLLNHSYSVFATSIIRPEKLPRCTLHFLFLCSLICRRLRWFLRLGCFRRGSKQLCT